MRILGLDTSGGVCSVGIMEAGEMIAQAVVNDKNTHSVNLMPLVDKVLSESGLLPKDVDAYAVNVGPGSFTGIRIGVTTVMGLAMQDETPCVAVNTLESLAYNALGYTGHVCAMVDARRAESYWALFYVDKNGVRREMEDGAEKVEEILKKLPNGEICFVGDGAVQNKALIEEILGANAQFLTEELMRPIASSVLKAAEQKVKTGETTTVFNLEPYYIRASQAEQMKP